MTTNQLMRLYNRVENLNNQLQAALETLSNAASKMYGQELQADLCGDNEIEFRLMDGEYIDEHTCIRIENILEHNNH